MSPSIADQEIRIREISVYTQFVSIVIKVADKSFFEKS
jgi:hypothetical protein